MQLKVFLAGRVGVEADDAVIDEARMPGRQGRLLFAYLAAEHGRAVPRDELAEALWGETPPPTSEKALAVIVSKLRGVLATAGLDGTNALTGAFGCYRLQLPEDTWIDVDAAADAAQEAEQALAVGDLEKAKAAGARAESLLRQPFLPGEDGTWVDDRRRDLADIRARAVSAMADASLRSGDAAEAAKWAEQAVGLAPFRETGYRQLMEAHAAAGNRAEALRVYERCRRLLAEELGAFPSPETDAIYRALLKTPSAPPLETPAEPSDPALAADDRVAPTRRRRRLLLAGVVTALAGVVAAVSVILGGGRSAPVAVVPDSVAVVDPARNAVRSDIALHAEPAGVAYGADSVWIATKDAQTLLQIDPRTRRISKTIGLGVDPISIATAGRYVWVLGTNALLEFDGRTDTRIRTVPLAGTIRVGRFKGEPLRLLTKASGQQFNLAAGAGAAWIGFGYDVVGRVDAETGDVEQIAAGSAAGVGFADGALWTAGWYADGEPLETIARIDARTRKVMDIPSANVGANRNGIYGLAGGSNSVWGINGSDNRAWKIDPELVRFSAVVPLDHSPADVAVGAGAVWLANSDATLSRIDPATASLIKTIPLGHFPRRAYPVAVAAGDNLVWVALH